MNTCRSCESKLLRYQPETMKWYGTNREPSLRILNAPVHVCTSCTRGRQWTLFMKAMSAFEIVDKVPDTITELEWEDYLEYALKEV